MMNNKIIFKYFTIFVLIAPSTLANLDSDNISDISYIESYHANNNFDLPGTTIVGAQTASSNDIKVAKEIIPSDNKNSMDINLTIKMPPKPAKLDIVLAMDTSGSMVQQYQEMTYLDWASEIVLPILKEYSDARVSIVSWDDDDEVGDSMTPFYNAAKENMTIRNKLNKLSQECLETDRTIYSIGVKRAIQKLNEEPATDYGNTSRIIIFVTGLSEFMAEPKNASNGLTLKEQLAVAHAKGYQIYPVKIGEPRFIWESENLSTIARETHVPGQPAINETYSIDSMNNLSSALEEILKGLKSKPIAYDMEVVDTLYPYLDYIGSQSILIFENSSSESIPVQIKNSSDGSTTFTWNIGTMYGNEICNVLIHTQLKLNLPVDVSPNRTELRYELANTTAISEVRYISMTGYKGIISLPEGEIVLSSGNSPSEGNGENANTKLTIKSESHEKSDLEGPIMAEHQPSSGEDPSKKVATQGTFIPHNPNIETGNKIRDGTKTKLIVEPLGSLGCVLRLMLGTS
jgi:hypothetical protein